MISALFLVFAVSISDAADEIAIEKAVMQVEKELAEEQFRENPSIWDMSADTGAAAADTQDDDRFKSPGNYLSSLFEAQLNMLNVDCV